MDGGKIGVRVLLLFLFCINSFAPNTVASDIPLVFLFLGQRRWCDRLGSRNFSLLAALFAALTLQILQ
jgi:hypothetical protein